MASGPCIGQLRTGVATWRQGPKDLDLIHCERHMRHARLNATDQRRNGLQRSIDESRMKHELGKFSLK